MKIIDARNATSRRVFLTLRIAVAMCFIGHGAFGIITKDIWCNYFAVFGIDRSTSYQLMPIIGITDIIFGLVIIVYPLRLVPAWLLFWGIITALLRPLSGEPFAEFVERAGNYGAPFALLLASGSMDNVRQLFTRMQPAALVDGRHLRRLTWTLRIFVFLLMAGHGWLNIIGKKGLLLQYESLGFSAASNVATIIGYGEMLMAFAVLIRPVRPLVLLLFFWKAGSELFYPNWALFEWIERGGSYGCILALWFILKMPVYSAAGADRQMLSTTS